MKERLIRQRELTARLNTYRDEYYNQNAPSVSDTVYDRLFDELTELEKETGVVMSFADADRGLPRCVEAAAGKARYSAVITG